MRISYLSDMKKIQSILFLSFLFVLHSANAQEISDAQIAFVNKFISSVEVHDQKATIKCTDKSYRKEQLKFLGGRKEQFINELFGGIDMLTDEYVNTRFANILKVEVAEIIPQSDESFEYIFRIRDGEHDFLTSLLLRKTKNKFGFIGAMG